MARFSDRLSRALEVRHMTASELSKLTGIGEGTISNYRKGRYEPKQRLLNKIAQSLNVSIAYLMGADVEIGEYELNGIREANERNSSHTEIFSDEYEKTIIDTYRKADIKQKMRIVSFITEIADEIEKNDSGKNGNGAVG